MKEIFLGKCFDTMINLIKYDRRDDEDLSEADVKHLFDSGKVTIEEVMTAFREGLAEHGGIQ